MRRSIRAMLTGSVFLLAGCHHRAKQVIVLPPAPPEIAPVMVSVPPPTHRSEPIPAPIAAVPPPPVVVEPPKKEKRQPRRSAATVVTPAPVPPVQTAATEPPPIELGELSAGGETTSGLKQETYNLIHALDARVAALPDGVASSHKREIERAKRFLKQAEDSWNTADMDGAHTLAVKAKVLLDDLQK